MTATGHPIAGEQLPRPPTPPPRRPTRWRWWVLIALAVAVVAIAAVVVVVAVSDDGTESPAGRTTVPTEPVPATTAAPPSTTVPPAPSTAPPTVPDAVALWPFPDSATRFASPEEAAHSFATAYLGFASPVVEPFQQGDRRSGEVPIRPRASGPVTTILVRQLGPGDDWSVLGAVTADIEVTGPAAGTEVASPVEVAGRALAFEGHVRVEVRQDGALGAIGAGFVTGGGDRLRPFRGSIPFETPGAPYGALVFLTESAEDGQVWEAATVRVALRSTDIDAVACAGYRSPVPRPGDGEMVVTAYFNCDAAPTEVAPFPVHRLVPASPRVLEASLHALLAGPNDGERAASIGSWFSAATAGMLRSVTITGGHAVVDLGDLRAVIPNASTSAGSALLLAQLDATVFQFRSVASVEYRIDGSCEAFTEWLQYGGCEPRTRPASPD